MNALVHCTLWPLSILMCRNLGMLSSANTGTIRCIAELKASLWLYVPGTASSARRRRVQAARVRTVVSLFVAPFSIAGCIGSCSEDERTGREIHRTQIK